MSVSKYFSPAAQSRFVSKFVLSISLLSGAVWTDGSYAAQQKSKACLEAMGNEHEILTQLAQFGMKTEQEKMAAQQDYCRLQTSRRESLQALKLLKDCELYSAERLDKFIASNQTTLDKKCK